MADQNPDHDTAFLAQLRRVSLAADPVPAWVVDHAKAAFLLHDVEGEIANLLGESVRPPEDDG